MAGRVLIVFDGTRGDAQPYIVAAKALIKGGLEVMVTGPGDASRMAEEFQVPFVRSRLSAQKVMAHPDITKQMANPDDPAGFVTSWEKKKAEFITEGSKERDLGSLCTLIQDWKPDLVLFGAVLLPLVGMIIKVVKVPVVSLTLQHGRMCKTLKPMWSPDWLPRFMWGQFWRFLVFVMAGTEFKQSGPALSKLLGVPMAQLRCNTNELSRYWSANANFLSIIGTSQAVHGDLPQEFNGNNVQIGALMPSLEQEGVSSFGSEEMQVVEEFLDSGSAPVYIGFGSIVCITSKFMALLCLRALRLTGERAILCRGWSTMCLEDLQGEVDEEDLKAYCHEKVLFVDKAPHGWLFPKCQVVVHHGGAGTLHASAMSGRPTVIVPIFVDQPEHSELVNKRGFGVGLKSMQKAKPLELADAIRKCINTPSIQAKAKEVAEQMKKEDASERLVEVIKDYMESHIRTGKHMKTVQELEQKKGGCWAGCCAGSGSSGASSSNY